MTENNKKIVGITALLVHAAKLDENYTDSEKKLIKSFINSFKNNKTQDDEILLQAEKLESDSNQLLSFTNIIKNDTEEVKFKVIENLWKIIISDNKIDQYESNLIRRICGLIYFSDKISGEIKLKILEELK
ncbi:TerB family tellurite resistance protein [Pelagibacteraceae bacterium]|nr:TerB family tellurite resistance protein [Pelagibacteraceae bacterium]